MPNAIEALQGETYINLETFKKDGTGVKTPVWFAVDGSKVIVFSDNTSFKIKRLGRNPKARFAACNATGKVHGEWFDATARLVPQGTAESTAGLETLRKKFPFEWAMITVGAKLSGSYKRRQIIVVEPT